LSHSSHIATIANCNKVNNWNVNVTNNNIPGEFIEIAEAQSTEEFCNF